MRIIGVSVVVMLVGLAAFQSIVGGAPESVATPEPLTITSADICSVEAMTQPVVRREARAFTIIPAHKTLAVTPAKFGTRIDDLVVVPEHREGATFFTEQKRVIVSEPTRRLRTVDPEFESVSSMSQVVKRARVEQGILIRDTVPLTVGPDTTILVREARIQAVRINAGLKMQEVKVIDQDGDGDIVPARTVPIEVRTVEVHPAVAAAEIEARVETREVEILEKPAEIVEVEAVCSIAGRTVLIESLQATLVEMGLSQGDAGSWSPATIDAVASAQAEATGLVSPYLLLETLRLWLPEAETPTS